MAIKLCFSSLSLGASVDYQTGNLSVFDVLEEIRVPQVPVHLQALAVALVLERTTDAEEKGQVFIHILTPDGKQQLLGNGELQIPVDRKRMKAVFRFGGFPLFAFGAHRMVVSWTDSAKTKQGEAIFDFDVIQVTQVAQGVPPAEGGKQGKPSLPN